MVSRQWASRGAGAAGVFDRHAASRRCRRSGCTRRSLRADEDRIARAGAGKQAEVFPNRADAQDVAHLVQHDAEQQAARFHAGHVGRVELHDAVVRQEAAGAERVGAGLAEDAVDAVDRTWSWR